MSQEAKLFLQHNSITIFKSYMYFLNLYIFFFFSFFLFLSFFSFFIHLIFVISTLFLSFYLFLSFPQIYIIFTIFTLSLQYLQYIYNITIFFWMTNRHDMPRSSLIDVNCDGGMLEQVAAIICTEHLVRSSIFQSIRRTFIFWNCNLPVLHQILSGHL